MLTKIYERNPSERELRRAAAVLDGGGVVICPTDSRYAFCCSVRSAKGLARLRTIATRSGEEFSLIFADFGQVAEYCRVDNAAFRLLKRHLPGAFTFILPALSRIPDRLLGRRRTAGIRIPAHPVVRALVETLGCPLVAVAVPDDATQPEYVTDPELLHERYGRDADLVIDGGPGGRIPTTAVDLTEGEPQLLRPGCGAWND